MRHGFGLLELAIALGVLALIALLTLPTLRIIDELTVSLAVDNLYAQLLSLQQQARLLGKIRTMTVFPEAGSYSVASKKYVLPPLVRFGIIPGVKGPPSKPLNTLSKPVTFTDQVITFHPSGALQSGALYLTDQAGLCLYAVTVGVAPYSYVRRYAYQDGWVLMS